MEINRINAIYQWYFGVVFERNVNSSKGRFTTSLQGPMTGYRYLRTISAEKTTYLALKGGGMYPSQYNHADNIAGREGKILLPPCLFLHHAYPYLLAHQTGRVQMPQRNNVMD